MKVWLHHLFNYLLFTILHKYKIEPMKAAESAVDIVSKNSHGNVCSKEFGKNMGFVNHSGLKFSPLSEHKETGTVIRCSVKKSVIKYFTNFTR